MATRPKFYIQVFGTGVDEPIHDVEKDFKGLYFAQVQGLTNKGKPKNIYTEEYADSDELRVFVPRTVFREATSIKMKLVFTGDDCRVTYENFYNFIKGNKFYYWDNVRNLKASLVLLEAIEPSDDKVSAGTKYIVAEFNFRNLFGECQSV